MSKEDQEVIDVDSPQVIDLEGPEYDSDNPQFVKWATRQKKATQRLNAVTSKRKQLATQDIIPGLNEGLPARHQSQPGSSRQGPMTGSSSASGSNKQRAASTVSTTNEVVELLSSDEESRPIKRARKDLYAASSSRPEQPPAKSDPRLSDENSLDYTSGYSADEEDVDPRVKEPIRKLQLQSIGEPDVESLRKIRDSLSASARIPASTKVLKTLRGSIRPSHSSRLSAPCPNQKPRSTSYAGELFYWEKFKYLRVQAPPVRQHDVHSRDSRGTRDRFRSIFGLTEQSLIHHSPGAINKVVQHNGCILAASAVSTGMYDEQPDAYNSDGALMYWNGKSALILHGHEDNPNSNNAASNKYYTVNDVQFDPLRPKRFVSVGMDRRIIFWNSAGSQPRAIGAGRFDCDPNSVSYKPSSSIVAVEGSNGVVYFHRADMSLHGNWHVAADSDEHYIADLTWGTGPSENLLFASTASSDENDHRGHHKAFDFAKMQPCLTFDLKVVGEKLTTDTKGERLAIVAREPDCHLLHQYDVRRRRQRPTSSIRIDASGMLGDAGKPTETNRIVYSPDGLHLALAFANNTAHVYDSRYLRSEPLHFLEHEGEEKENTYGIVEAQWTEEVGLVTGGADGCVRLWDVRRSSEDLRNGRVIAQRDNDIGHFSLGDTAKGEHTLVVGECSGHVTMFDHRGSKAHYEDHLDGR